MTTSPFTHITRCMDLKEGDIVQAVATRDGTRELLARLTAVSAPSTGVAKVLLVFARMATTGCDWIEGDLRIELRRQDDVTRIDVASDLGGGLLERIVPSLTVRAPLDEFSRAIERVPRMVLPLVVQGRTDKRLVLSATAAIRRTSVPPPHIEVSAESLFVHPPPVAPPPQKLDPVRESLPVIAPLPGTVSVRESLPVLAPLPGTVSVRKSLPVIAPSPGGVSYPPIATVDEGWDE